jgi:radical S-adenosyl methionine domain-containing protein 2
VIREDDMSSLAMRLRPERWKVFQVLPVEGQNDDQVEPLLITSSEFESWVERHRRAVAGSGVTLVAESNENMRGTYAMMDAECR